MAAVHASRGCAFGDFDNDGDVDVLVMNMNEPPSLLRNDVSGNGHWLKVLLVGVKSNRSAIGARVVARYGEPQPGAGGDGAVELLLRQRPPPALRTGRLDLRGPHDPMAQRRHGKVPNVEADQLVVIREGAGILRRHRFGSG